MDPMVILEPLLLSVPNTADDKLEATRILNRIIDWSRCILQKRPVSIGILPDTLEILAEENCFPSHPNIQALLEIFDLREIFSVGDLRTHVNVLLERSEMLSNLLRVDVKRWSELTTAPDILTKHGGGKFEIAAERIFSSIAFAAVVNPILTGMTAVSLGNPAQRTVPVTISSIITDATSELDSVSLPCEARTITAIVDSYSDFLECLEPGLVWDRAEAACDLHFAIALEAWRIAKVNNPRVTVLEIPRFFVGSEFFQSTKANDCGPMGNHASLLLESCARIVLDCPKNALNPFKARSASGKLIPKIRVDNARAFRTHLLKSHDALRLMFWKHHSGHVEFANVGSKFQLAIEEGLPSGCYGEPYWH